MIYAQILLCLAGLGLFIAGLLALVERSGLTARLMLAAAAVLTFSALPLFPGMSAWGVVLSVLLLAAVLAGVWWLDRSTDVLPKSRPRRWSLLVTLSGVGLLVLGILAYTGDFALGLIDVAWLVRMGSLMAIVMGLDLIGYGVWMLSLTESEAPKKVARLPYALPVAVVVLSLSLLWAWATVSLIPLVLLMGSTCAVLFLMLRVRTSADLPLIGMLSVASLGKGAVGLAIAIYVLPLAALGAFFAIAGLGLVMQERQRRGLTWLQLINP